MVVLGSIGLGMFTWAYKGTSKNSSAAGSLQTSSSSVRVSAKERRQELQAGSLILVESKLVEVTNINAANQLLATKQGFYPLPSQVADIVESGESWWWEPLKTGPNDFRMYIRNSSNTAMVGVLLKIHEGDCRSLKANPQTSWNYFFLQLSSPLKAEHAAVIRADMPFATHFHGCAVVTTVYAETAEFESAIAAYDKGDYATALRLFRKLADQGNARAQSNLGVMYRQGYGVAQNDTEAAKWFRLAADQGIADAQNFLGGMYDLGRGVPKSDTEAVKWYRLAADQGNARAQSNLGASYLMGEGVPQDDTEAVKWYRLAADQGNAAAQSTLGWMYFNGRGVPKSDTEAVKWYRLAADQGLAIAQTNLGVMYREGHGVAQNQTEAAKWFRLAADQGLADAQSFLGGMYDLGQGVRQNDAEAVKWYRSAAAQGNAFAQFFLGMMYESGRSVPQSYVNADMWFNLAAAQGGQDNASYKVAMKGRYRVEESMTPAQITEARELAREWQSKSTRR